jgi:TolB protein
MMRSLRSAATAALLVACVAPLRAQDTTFRGITISGQYDPRRDKPGIAVLPVGGAFGDSIRAIIQRDLDFSDRFTVVPLDAADTAAFRATGAAAGLNYSVFARLGAVAVVQIIPVATGIHLSLHDVAKAAVINVDEFELRGNGLGRDWRMGVHRASDEIERWITGAKGIAATRIAYTRGQSIRITDSDGADEITVPTEPDASAPAWNPAGTMLTYSTFGNSSRVLIMDLATGRSRAVLPDVPNILYVTPAFTPDGNSVVYSRTTALGSELFAVGVSGGDAPRQLTAARVGENTHPTMSPDGRRIAFTSGRLGRPELYIMDSDGTEPDLLTKYDFSEKNYRSDPDWSPDGRLIAYQEMVNGRFQLRTIPVRGGTPKALTTDGENEQPSWAPDGRHLVFTSSRTGTRQLWVLDTETGRLRQLTKSGGSRLAAWSPRLAGQ